MNKLIVSPAGNPSVSNKHHNSELPQAVKSSTLRDPSSVPLQSRLVGGERQRQVREREVEKEGRRRVE